MVWCTASPNRTVQSVGIKPQARPHGRECGHFCTRGLPSLSSTECRVCKNGSVLLCPLSNLFIVRTVVVLQGLFTTVEDFGRGRGKQHFITRTTAQPITTTQKSHNRGPGEERMPSVSTGQEHSQYCRLVLRFQTCIADPFNRDGSRCRQSACCARRAASHRVTETVRVVVRPRSGWPTFRVFLRGERTNKEGIRRVNPYPVPRLRPCLPS